MPEEPDEDNQARHWWQTIPGALTAIAGLITAVTGLIVALNQVLPESSNVDSVATTPPAALEPRKGPDTPRGAAYRATFPNGTEARIGEAVYEILGALVERQNPGQLALKVSIRMNNNGPYDANFWDRSFRLLVDDVPRAPTGGLNELVPARSAADATVTFVVPERTGRVALLVGEDASKAVRIPIDLQAATRR